MPSSYQDTVFEDCGIQTSAWWRADCQLPSCDSGPFPPRFPRPSLACRDATTYCQELRSSQELWLLVWAPEPEKWREKGNSASRGSSAATAKEGDQLRFTEMAVATRNPMDGVNSETRLHRERIASIQEQDALSNDATMNERHHRYMFLPVNCETSAPRGRSVLQISTTMHTRCPLTQFFSMERIPLTKISLPRRTLSAHIRSMIACK